MAIDSLGRKIDPNSDLVQLALGLVGVDPVEDSEGAIGPEEARLNSEAARQAMESNPRLMTPDTKLGEWSWIEDYLALKKAGWPWRVAAFIAWAASPKIDRWPKTQDELATTVLGLNSDRAIGNWRRKNAAIDTTIAMMQAAPLIQHRADIYLALVASASQPDHRSNPDRKLALELLGDYTPHMKIEDDRLRALDGAAVMSRDQLLKLAGEEFTGEEPPSAEHSTQESPLTPLPASKNDAVQAFASQRGQEVDDDE